MLMKREWAFLDLIAQELTNTIIFSYTNSEDAKHQIKGHYKSIILYQTNLINSHVKDIFIIVLNKSFSKYFIWYQSALITHTFFTQFLYHMDLFERIHDHKIIYRGQDKDADISNHPDKEYLYRVCEWSSQKLKCKSK